MKIYLLLLEYLSVALLKGDKASNPGLYLDGRSGVALPEKVLANGQRERRHIWSISEQHARDREAVVSQ